MAQQNQTENDSNTMIFYPIFCLRCQTNWLSKNEIEDCIFCGSKETVGYNRSKNYDKVREPKTKKHMLGGL